ncbi:hypothetical protein ACIGW3_08325 [Streptomyces sp. NPDC053499]|uniref:hypothetical protein n=1 Tax=Streptomyces sp. NPDC053499 TaxID=3365707 RepID=UPI0037D42730
MPRIRQTIALGTSASSGGDQQDAFLVGLRRGDLHQRDHFAGRGQPVLQDAVVAELQHLLDPDAGVPQHFDRGPGPESSVLGGFEVGPSAAGLEAGGGGAVRVGGPVRGAGLAVGLAEHRELGSGRRGFDGTEAGPGVLEVPVGGADEGRKVREPLAGALV